MRPPRAKKKHVSSAKRQPPKPSPSEIRIVLPSDRPEETWSQPFQKGPLEAPPSPAPQGGDGQRLSGVPSLNFHHALWPAWGPAHSQESTEHTAADGPVSTQRCPHSWRPDPCWPPLLQEAVDRHVPLRRPQLSPRT